MFYSLWSDCSLHCSPSLVLGCQIVTPYHLCRTFLHLLSTPLNASNCSNGSDLHYLRVQHGAVEEELLLATRPSRPASVMAFAPMSRFLGWATNVHYLRS